MPRYLSVQAGHAVKMPWEELARKKDTIEHILPQTLDSGGYWAEHFTPKEHERYLHDIGNLTLTFDNSILSNKSFPDKKGKAGQSGCYASSKLFIEQCLAGCEDWTVAEIQERRQGIKEWAVERWYVKAPTSTSLTQGGDPPPPVEAIQHVLTRKFIPYGQMTLYHALYAAGERGLSKTELAEQIRDGDTDSLTGVFGALGGRINGSGPFKAQKPGTGLFFKRVRRDNDWHYCMYPELREAIEKLPGLHEAITWSLDEILDKYRQEWWSDHVAQRDQLEKSD
ncbi:MAG: HNH endonuclease [Chloroflexi bacterium]|nr:HNH endonuclease [Chloroflexota bacterium]